MLTTFVFVLAFCLVAVLVYMARYSGRLRVSQQRTFDAPLAEVYARVVAFRNWSEWNPWLEHETDAPSAISAGAAGEGCCYAWDSPRIGAAAIEHVRMTAGERIEQRMRFKHPFAFHGRGDWQFSERSGKTDVTWRFVGRVAFPLRAFAPTVQSMIALDYRYGLDRLARLIEPPNSAQYSIAYIGLRDVPAQRYVFAAYDGNIDGIGEALQTNLSELRQQLDRHGVASSEDPIAVYVKTNIKLRTTVCHMGIPIDDSGFALLPVRTLPEHRAYVVRLQGSRAALEIAWYHAMQRMRIENIQPDQRIPPYERYLGAASELAEGGSPIELYIPVRTSV